MKKVLFAAAILLSLGASAQLSAQERGKIAVGGGLSYMTEGGQNRCWCKGSLWLS